MPDAERTTRISERCSSHPAVASVARCDGCGRPMCLACATPVRGGALGPECLPAALGPDAPPPEVADPVAGARARALGRLAFGLALLATLLPWSRFGAGSEPFGAWSRSARWSILVVVAAVAGVLISTGRLLLPRASPLDLLLVAAGSLVTLGSGLSLLDPPAFTSPWLGPWVALGAGIAATAASVASRGGRRRDLAHV